MPARGTNSGISLEQGIYLHQNAKELQKLQDDLAERVFKAEEAEKRAEEAWEDFDKENADFLAASDALKVAKANFEAHVKQENTNLEQEKEILRRRELDAEAAKRMADEAIDALKAKEEDLKARESDLNTRLEDLRADEERLDEQKADLAARKAELKERENRLDARIKALQAPV